MYFAGASYLEANENPFKKSKKGGAKMVFLKIVIRENLSYGKQGTLESNHTVKFTRSIWHHDIQASGIRGDGQSRKGRSSSLASHSKAKQTDGEERKSPQGSGKNRKTRSVRVKFLANSISLKIHHVSSGIFPCQKYNFYPRRFST